MLVAKQVVSADGASVLQWVPAALPVVPAYLGSVIRRGEMNDLRQGGQR